MRSHTASTIRSADLILVVEDGLIVERGTHRGTAGRGWAVRGIAPTQFAVQKNAGG
jgi:ATP-binding cassette subfamily C protein